MTNSENPDATTVSTDNLPTLDADDRRSVKKVAAVGVTIAGLLLLADDGYKAFKRRKNVEVTVETTDKPDQS